MMYARVILLFCGFELTHSTTVDPDDFSIIQGTGTRKFILSKYSTDFITAGNFCDSINSQLPMFETNKEYTAIYEYLNVHFHDFVLWVKIAAVDRPVGLGGKPVIDYFWENETFDDAMWTKYDPNGDCNSGGKTHCCAVIKADESLAGDSVKGMLVDSDLPCNKRLCHFLCSIPGYVNMLGDECLNKSHECSHICVDNFIGYHCSCPSGFKLDVDGKKCLDINECNSTSSLCNHKCVNSEGSFKCDCDAGYFLNQTNSCVDIDECVSRAQLCDHECSNSPGFYACSCYFGFNLTDNNRTCEDINECELYPNVCEYLGRCVNNNGSYFCEYTSGLNISTSTDVRYEDMNACDLELNTCPHMSKCVNSDGSYTCLCESGFQLADDGDSCDDVNECSDGSHNCSQLCTNTDGGFICSCHNGYQDISNTCHLLCSNEQGSYLCQCESGFQIDTDYDTCKDIDKCTIPPAACDQICKNSVGYFLCSCHNGYVIGANNSQCQDVDECRASLNYCEQVCFNADGSFSCSCFTGYEVRADNLSMCQDTNECLFQTHNCSENEICINTNGSFECARLARYTLDVNSSFCMDIDECLDGLNDCKNFCNNTEGGYTCQCSTGFQGDDPLCEDIEECMDPLFNTCSQVCNNTIGSFLCACLSGYTLVNKTLYIHQDECHHGMNFSCEQTCHYTEGSFICGCEPGYTLNNDGIHCDDIDECNKDNTAGVKSTCDDYCINTVGSYQCACGDGFRLGIDLKSCIKRERNMCHCQCSFGNDFPTMKDELDMINASLVININSLNSYKRKLHSIRDTRLVPQILGCSCVLIMFLCAAVVIVSDVIYWI